MSDLIASIRCARSGLVAAALVAVAATTVGCTSSSSAPEVLTQVRTTPERPALSLPGAPLLDDRPTVANLDADLLAAVRAATRDAQADGVSLVITSGWRSRAHQQRLLDEAVRRYGSEDEARRFVSTPDSSAHVSGDAVDIGPTDADDWLGRHGAEYGLCQMFANEIWHFELATTPGGDCPEMLPDSSYRG